MNHTILGTSSNPEAIESKKTLRRNFWLTLVGFMDTHLIIPIVAIYATTLNASVGMVGLIVGSYSIANTAANILFGRLIDKTGVKMPLLGGLIGDALAMFLYTLCRLPIHLVLVRVFHGIAGGLVGPSTMTIAVKGASEKQRGRTMAFYGMSLALATIVGYALSGLIASRLSYHWVFYAGAMFSASGAIVARHLPNDVGAERIRPSSFPSLSRENYNEIIALIKRRGAFVAYFCVFGQYFALGSVATLLPLYLKTLGMGVLQVGMLLTIFAIAFFLTQLRSGIVSDRMGRHIPLIVGIGLCTASLAFVPNQDSLKVLMVLMAVYGVSHALIFPSTSALLADHTTPGERGKATGIFHAMLTGGVAAGALVMGFTAGIVGIRLAIALSCSVLLSALPAVLIDLRKTRVRLSQPY